MPKLSFKEFKDVVKQGIKNIRAGIETIKATTPYSALLLLGGGALIAAVPLIPVAFFATAIALTGGVTVLGAVLGTVPVEISGAKKTITETNEAGQAVSGQYVVLRRLQLAQDKINSLTSAFNKAATLPEDVQAKVDNVIEATKHLQDKVKIVDTENNEIAGEKYAFTRILYNVQKL